MYALPMWMSGPVTSCVRDIALEGCRLHQYKPDIIVLLWK